MVWPRHPLPARVESDKASGVESGLLCMLELAARIYVGGSAGLKGYINCANRPIRPINKSSGYSLAISLTPASKRCVVVVVGERDWRISFYF